MPTGYTSAIDDNPELAFNEFVWRCARAFGALVTMRDDSLDAQIPDEFQPDRYYRESVAQKEAALNAASAMTLVEAANAMQADRERIERSNAKHMEKHNRVSAAYARMRLLAEAWQPPSSDHAGIRSFMLEQLATGDPGELYLEKPSTLTAEQWLREHIASARKSLEYAQQSLREEEERCRKRTAWLKDLRESVPMPKKGGPDVP